MGGFAASGREEEGSSSPPSRQKKKNGRHKREEGSGPYSVGERAREEKEYLHLLRIGGVKSEKKEEDVSRCVGEEKKVRVKKSGHAYVVRLAIHVEEKVRSSYGAKRKTGSSASDSTVKGGDGRV